MKKVSVVKKSKGMDMLAYGLAALLLLTGQILLLAGRISPGAGLTVLAVAVAAGRLLLSRIRVDVFVKGARELVARPAKNTAPTARASRASFKSGTQAQTMGWDAAWKKYFPKDLLLISRHWMGLPLGLGILLLQLALLKGSIARAGLDLVLLGMLASIYLQDLSRPLVLPNFSKNLRTCLKLFLALPFEAYGFWLLWNYTYVWTGYFLTILGTLWMLWVLKKTPFELVEADRPGSNELDYIPENPWFNSQNVAVKVALVVGAAICAFLSLQVLGSAQAGLRVALAFLGMLLLVGSFPWLPHGISSWSLIPKASRAWVALILALAAFFIGAYAQDLMEAGAKEKSLWIFLLAGILLVGALSRFDSSRFPEYDSEGEALPRTLKFEIFAFSLLILTAFLFRRWNIEWFPYGAEGDEAGGGVWAMDALRGSVEHPLIHQNYPLHFFSVTAVFFKIFGVSVGTMRWHSVLFGTLSVASFYFFARLFFGSLTAWLSAALMAFSFWHLHYSRFGHYNIEQVFCQMAAFYFVFKGMKTGLWKYFAVAGAAFALAMFPHMAGRLLPFQGMAFVGYLLIFRRDLLRRQISGLLVFVLGAWLVAAPAVTYWVRATTVSMGRIQSVSIFDKNNSNAPVDVLAGFVQNCKVSILMFNDTSDSRTRDNPLAPQKILEHWSAILFALAFCYLLYHWRDPIHFFLLSCFFINLSASVFSVEAPQTLRTAGNIPIVFAMIAVLLAHFYRALLDLGVKWGTFIYVALLLPAVSLFSYRSAWKYFVEAGHQSFDVPPTYIAQMAGRRGKPQDQAVFFASGFASGHPPVVLFSQKTPIRNFYHLNEYLPVTQASDRDHHIFLADDYAMLLPYVKALYPQAKVETIPNRMGGQPIAEYLFIPKEQLKAAQGLRVEGRDSSAKAFVRDGAGLEFPLAGLPVATRHLHFSGSLRNEGYGSYVFSASGVGDVELRLEGRIVYSRHGGVVRATESRLPAGLLALSADFNPGLASDHIAITEVGRPAEFRLFCSLRNAMSDVISSKNLFRMKPMGMYARYYATRDWSGPVVLEMIEPGIFAHWLDSPIGGNWSVKWKGRLKIDKSGLYSFRFDGMNTLVWVDGQLVYRGGAAIKPEMHPPKILSQVQLSAGNHILEAAFSSTGPPGMDLMWKTPGGQDELLQPALLEPLIP